MNQMLESIAKTREYLDYIEEHYNNIQKAWEIAKVKWEKMNVIYDDYKFHMLDQEVKNHDESKLSEHELVQYRKYFFPTDYEEYYANTTQGAPSKAFAQQGFDKGWEHHKEFNPHHWQTINCNSYASSYDIAHMVLDWIAMGYKFGDTALAYYEKTKDTMTTFTRESHDYVKELLEVFYQE